MLRILATAWAAYRARQAERSARAFHRAMGHSCSFCTYQER
jgi:hypothetical protein